MPTARQRLSLTDYLFVSSSSDLHIRIVVLRQISQSAARTENALDTLFYSNVSLYNSGLYFVSLVAESAEKLSRSSPRKFVVLVGKTFVFSRRLDSGVHRGERFLLSVFSTSVGRIHFLALRRKSSRLEKNERSRSSFLCRSFLFPFGFRCASPCSSFFPN